MWANVGQSDASSGPRNEFAILCRNDLTVEIAEQSDLKQAVPAGLPLASLANGLGFRTSQFHQDPVMRLTEDMSTLLILSEDGNGLISPSQVADVAFASRLQQAVDFASRVCCISHLTSSGVDAESPGVRTFARANRYRRQVDHRLIIVTVENVSTSGPALTN